MALLGRILLFILLLLLIITVGASLYAKPQFFAKELTDIPARDGSYLPRLCGGEANWECYVDSFYELWGTIDGEEQSILDAKTMYEMMMMPYGVTGNEFYLLDDGRTILIKTAGVWGWQTSHRLILYDIIDKVIKEASNYYYVEKIIKHCKDRAYANTKIVSTKHYRPESEGGGWNGEETRHLVSLDNKTYYGGGRDNLNFNGFIFMPEIQEYENFIFHNECVLYNKLQL